MSIIGTLLANLFGGVFAWFAGWLGKKVAFGAAVVVGYGVLVASLLVVMRGAQNSLNDHVTSLPANVMQLVGFFIPTAFPYCLGLVITTWVACTLFSWQREALRLMAAA